MNSRQNCSLGEFARALSDNRELYIEQSACTKAGVVPRIHPWRTGPSCQTKAAKRSYQNLSNQGEPSNDEHA